MCTRSNNKLNQIFNIILVSKFLNFNKCILKFVVTIKWIPAIQGWVKQFHLQMQNECLHGVGCLQDKKEKKQYSPIEQVQTTSQTSCSTWAQVYHKLLFTSPISHISQDFKSIQAQVFSFSAGAAVALYYLYTCFYFPQIIRYKCSLSRIFVNFLQAFSHFFHTNLIWKKTLQA